MEENLRIVVVGAGGLGHPAVLQLAESWTRSGELVISILDSDSIERSNLNRQILFAAGDIGSQKACTLARRLEAHIARTESAGKVRVSSRAERLNPDNTAELLANADLVLDCTDHIPTKFLINDFCVTAGIPFCYAGAVELEGLCLAVPRHNGSRGCLRCLFGADSETKLSEETRTCQSAGILGPVAGIVGAAEALAALQLLDPGSRELPSRLYRFSAKTMGWSTSDVRAVSDCPLGCGKPRAATLDLTDKQCPYTFLYTKLALDELEPELRLEAVYDSHETRENVRRSVEREGHRVVSAAKVSARGFHLLVEKCRNGGES